MRLRASTLLETLISMAMIGGILATSMLLYSSVLHSDRSWDRLQARTLIDSTYARIIADRSVEILPVTAGDRTITIEWNPLPQQLREVHVSVLHDQVMVLDARRILQGPWRD